MPVEIIVIVIHLSDWKGLMTWRAVCRAFFKVVGSLMRRRYEAHVEPYVSDIPLFDSIMRRHGAIISGSTALRFFMPNDQWSPRDLDIYVPDAHWTSFLHAVRAADGLNWQLRGCKGRRAGATTVGATSTRDTSEYSPNESGVLPRSPTSSSNPSDPVRNGSVTSDESGYDSSEDETADEAPDSRGATRHSQKVKTFSTPSGRSVDVVRSPSNNPITPLRFFWSTTIMNFLTPDACVCGFPSATFNHAGVLKLGAMRERDAQAVRVYEGRGYTFRGDEMRELLDMWEYLFFGERNALVCDFRVDVHGTTPPLPIRRTSRGWVPTVNTTIPTPGPCAVFFTITSSFRSLTSRSPLCIVV